MAKFFRCMIFELSCDIVKSGAFYRLAVDRVGDNGLVFAR